MIAVVVGLAYSAHAQPGDVALSVAVTALGLWLASLVADGQAHRVVHRRGSDGRDLLEMLYVSSPLLLSAAGPLFLILLAALVVMSLHTALLTAAWVNVASLFTWGWFGGVRMGSGLVVSLLGGAVDAAIGTAVALVKAAGH
ncbi:MULTISPECIES: hypothetical protein [unclassified Streptomyces]|uniref:hypothetical protein n=1 Tax=unclassified Streptomyces TaxID=2593676 RepID=UPI002E2EBF4B|nr:hypothetical protein [Streptomyces sp. NBC_01278]